MWKRLLGVGAFLIYGSFGLMNVGAEVAQAHVAGDPEEMILELETSDDQTSDDMEPAYKEVRCRVPGSFACMEQCYGIGATCSQFVLHPYRVESGQGTLYWCKGGRPTYTCSYRFANGEHCHYLKPFGIPYCVYEGGK